MLLPLIGARLRRRSARAHEIGSSFTPDRWPPPAEEHSHVGSWLYPSGMIGVRDHGKDVPLGARETVKWYEGSIQ